MDHPMRILIADDDRHTRAGLRALLGTYPACEIVGEAVNGQEAIEQIECCRPDAVLLSSIVLRERLPNIVRIPGAPVVIALSQRGLVRTVRLLRLA